MSGRDRYKRRVVGTSDYLYFSCLSTLRKLRKLQTLQLLEKVTAIKA
jgi:hypothetical protein